MPETPQDVTIIGGSGWKTVCSCSFCGKEVRYHAIQMHWKNHCPKAPKITEDERICSKCQTVKPMSEFRKRVNLNGSGHPRTCRECTSGRLHDWRCRIGRSQRKISNTEEARRNRKNRGLKFTHGITIDEFERMHREQSGKCAICGKTPEGLNRRTNSLHVDHDHKTGKIRGLLCHFCNVGIGHFNEDPALLVAALDYLTRHKSQ